MVVKLFCGEDFSNHEHEWNQFIELYETIRENYEKSNQHIYFLVNFSLSNAQIDVLLLTENGMALIDLKSYKGKIIGSENGNWKVVTENDEEVIMNKNLFLQLQSHKFAFLEKLNTIREGNFERIEREKLGRIKCWGYFENGSTYDINQVGKRTHIWFGVVTSDNIIQKMRFIDAGYFLKLEDMNAIVNGLNLTEYSFEEEKPLTEKNGSGQEKTIEIEETKSEDAFSTSINEYLNSIINEENTIINDDVEIGISNVYTELSAKISAKNILPIKLKFGEQENSREEESEVLDLVEKEKNLIISGASGSGKTITLKWLNIIFAEKYFNEGNCSIPLYIELNSYKEGNFYDYIKIKAKEKGLPESTLELLLNGKLIFLIDGLDLLSLKEGFAPFTEISNFISEYSECRYVISSRPGFSDGIQNKFKISELKELDEANIQSFLNNYIIDKKLANIITGQILNDDKLISLFKNPMMLYLAIIVIKSRLEDGININEVLPSKRSSLYEVFISELFKHHKRKGKSFNADKTQILETLTNLYFKLQCQNDVDCTYKYAINIALEHSDDKTLKFAKNTLDDLFNIGLLLKYESRNDIDDYVKYGIHQSFLEYFAALKLKDCFESGYDLSPVFKHPKWEDVVIFAAEMFDYPDDFINKIIDSHELDLASKCAQNASKDIKEKLCKFLAEKFDDGFISERIYAIESLGRLGDIGISLVIETFYEDTEMKWRAIYALGEIKSDKAVDGLIKALADEDSWVRRSAVDALGEIKSNKAVDGLIKALADEDSGVRSSAVDALGEIESDKAVDSLIKALADEDSGVRSSAANALGEIKSDKAVDGLIKALADRFVFMLGGDADALGKIESDKAVDCLIKELNDEDPIMQMNAAFALGKIKSDKAVDGLIKALADEDSGLRRSAASGLRKNESDKAVDGLIKALADEDSRVRSIAADSLGEIKSDKAVDNLIKALADEDPEVKLSTAFALGKIKSDKAFDGLIKALADEDSGLRRSAALALGEIESDKAVDSLIKALADEDPGVRSRVADALGEIESDKAVDSLIKALSDEDPGVRRSAADALGEIESDKAVDSLIKALADEDPGVRSRVADALGEIESDKAVDSLIKALSDEDPGVRRSAADALGEIESDKAVDSLIKALSDEDPGVRRSTADALGEIESDKAVDGLIKALSDEDPMVRSRVADALGEIESDKAVDGLIKALSDEDPMVRSRVADALGEIESDKAVDGLIKALSDEDSEVRSSAANALGKIINTENKYLLKPLLESQNKYVANMSYLILKHIDQNDRSKKEIILKRRSISEKDDSNKGINQELPCGRPAEEGLRDPYIGSFVDRLKSIKEPTSIVDYGCGQGKLLCALTTLQDVAIENISYFGVDEKTQCCYTSRLTAEKYGLFNLFKTEPEFLKPKDFYAKNIKLDYALLMHALHEIKLLDLIEIIYSISAKLKMGGQMFILDQRELIEKERNFVLWDDKKDFEILFSDSGLEVSQRFFNTGSDKKLSSIEATKVQDNCFPKENVANNCLKVYNLKKRTVSERIDRKEMSNEKFQELNIFYSNISRQIDEYNESIKLA